MDQATWDAHRRHGPTDTPRRSCSCGTASAGSRCSLAERPLGGGSFAGAWVFPGGRVDRGDVPDGDPSNLSAAINAAVSETREEIGLEIDAGELVPFSRWTPPAGSPRSGWSPRSRGAGRPTASPSRPAEVVARSNGSARSTRSSVTRPEASTSGRRPWVTLHGLPSADVGRRRDGRTPSGTSVRAYESRFTDEQPRDPRLEGGPATRTSDADHHSACRARRRARHDGNRRPAHGGAGCRGSTSRPWARASDRATP